MLVSAASLLAPLASGLGAAGRLKDELGPGARVLETEHFVLAHTGAVEPVRRLSAHLESVYRAHVRFARELRLTARRPQRKLEVLVLPTHAAFLEFARRAGQDAPDSLGYYDAQQDRSVFFDLASYPPVADVLRELESRGADDWQRRRALRQELTERLGELYARVVQHEAAHQVQATFGITRSDGFPVWLREGLAQLFELPFLQEGATLELSVNRGRLAELVALYPPGTDWEAQVARLVSGDDAWRGGADYPVAWALTRFLFVRHRDAFREYLMELAAGTATPREAFERHFGTLDGEFGPRFAGHVTALIERDAPVAPAGDARD